MSLGIDWLAVGSMLQGIGAVVSGIAIVIAAIVGSNTYNNWRRQKIAERTIEHAEAILTAAYRVKRELSFVRSPMMWVHELIAAEEKIKEKGEWNGIALKEREGYKTLYGYYIRIENAKEARQKLESCYPYARALFGQDLDRSIQDLNHYFHKISVYARAQLKDNGVNPNFTSEIEMHLYEGWTLDDKENPVDIDITRLVSEIENICIPVLRMDKSENGIQADRKRNSRA
jgi:hypothetical protein